MSLDKLPPPNRRHAFEWLYLLTMLVALGLYIAVSKHHEHSEIDRLQRARLLNQTEVIEKNLIPQLVSTSHALNGIMISLPTWKKEKDGFAKANQQLKLLSDTLTGIRTLLIVDATGKVVASSNSDLVGRAFSEREYFKVSLAQPQDGRLHVSPPFRTALNAWVMSVSRTILEPNGNFGGVVVASVDPSHFNTLLDSVRDTQDMWTYLAHDDGRLIMMAPERSDLHGMDLGQPGSMFYLHVHSKQRTSLLNVESTATGPANRLTALRTIQPPNLNLDKPLVVAVSRDTDQVFAGWRSELKEQLGLFLLLCLLTTASLFLYQRRRLEFMRVAHSKEVALRASDARLHSIFSATPDALLICNAAGQITMANQQVERLLGYSVEELIGRSVEELVPIRNREHHTTQRAEFAGNPSARRMGNGLPVKARRKDGSECDVEISLSRIETNEGLFFASAMRDITERLGAKTSLLASETRLRTIIENEPDCIKVVDENGLLVQMNPAGLAMIEADSLEQVVGLPVIDVIAPEFKEDFSSLHKRVLAGESANLKFKIIGLKGRHRWLETHAVPMIDNGKRVHLAVTRDITASQEADADLRVAAAAFESQHGLVVTDANSVILRVNQSFTDTTGYTAEDVVGQTPRILKSGRHNADFYRAMWETIRRTGKWEGEIWDRRKNGNIYLKWLSISTVRDEHGNVSHYVGAHQDITERKKAEERIHELAFYDQLTGLPNRTLLIDRLKQATTAASRNALFGALLFIDLDNFKTLNDSLGHDIGDLLLKQVASRLTACVRDGDTVARLGGDEFVIVIAGLGDVEVDAAKNAEAVAEKILSTLNQPYQLGYDVHRSTASIGVTLFSNSAATIDDLMKQADLAMYRAKETGRNVLRFFDPAMETAILKRADMEKDLRGALINRNFVLHYQAQIEGIDRVIGAEVLVRWLHPIHGVVPPADFIPLAEETGLIVPIGQWVLETACTQLAEWNSNPTLAHLSLSVNVSALQFLQVDFVETVIDLLRQTGANPHRLKLELTESMLVSDVEDIIEKMVALKALGVGFSLDDFGTGYSSLSYLKRLPLDQLKIDQSFIRDILVDSNDATIAKMVVALSVSLGLTVIAEGVESEEQREFVSSFGCSSYQGYLFSRPLALKEFETFLLAKVASQRETSYECVYRVPIEVPINLK